MNVNFIIDEFGALGHMKMVDTMLALGRGYSVKLQLYVQSLGQLKTCFPKDEGQTALSNTTQVFFGTNDYQTAEHISKRLGESTIVVDGGGSSSGYSVQGQDGRKSTSYSNNSSRDWKQMGRALLKPDEVLRLDAREAITFAPGKAIRTRLLRYYEERLRPCGLLGETFAAMRTFFKASVVLAGAAFLAFLMWKAVPKGGISNVRTSGSAVWPAGKGPGAKTGVHGRDGSTQGNVQGRR